MNLPDGRQVKIFCRRAAGWAVVAAAQIHFKLLYNLLRHLPLPAGRLLQTARTDVQQRLEANLPKRNKA
jgi:hypothetical protein